MYSIATGKPSHRVGPQQQQGFSLVEFMVAMTLGLVIMLAVSDIFVNNSQTRAEIERSGRQIENGRFALQLLSDEISNAGFFGESGVQPVPLAAPDVCLKTTTDVQGSMALPIVGGDNVAVASAPDCLSDYKDGGDYIAIRRSATCTAGSTGCDGFLKDHYHLQVAACRDTTKTIHTVGSVVLGTVDTDMTAKTRKCEATPAAPIYRYLSRIYYVRDGDVLARAELQNPADASPYTTMALVDGIERLHLEYGVDSDGDGVADKYVSSIAATDPDWKQWKDVVVVRITLLARTLEATPGYTDTNTYTFPGGATYTPNDSFKRQLYSAVVRVNNVAGRRE